MQLRVKLVLGELGGLGVGWWKKFGLPLSNRISLIQWSRIIEENLHCLWFCPYRFHFITCGTGHLSCMGLLPDTYNCGLCMHRKCRERFPRYRQMKPVISDSGMHHGTCVTHARAVMHFGIANPRWRENVPSIPGAYATRNFTYLTIGPRHRLS